MKIKSLIVLGLMATSALVASCVQSADSNNAANTGKAGDTATPLAAETEQRAAPTPFKDWMAPSPFRENMRRFWVDMGLIVANSARPEVADMAELESAADDLERRAARFAGYWKDVRDGASASIKSARAENWEGVLADLDKTHHACGSCHFEFWTQAARGYLPATLKGWQDNNTPFGSEFGKQVFSAPPKVSKSMLKVGNAMVKSYDAYRAQDLSAFSSQIQIVYKMADAQFKQFNSIAINAREIGKAAETGNLTSVKKNYNQIAAMCITCHAKAAPETSLNPLPWTAARD